jgi:hypothetical protein
MTGTSQHRQDDTATAGSRLLRRAARAAAAAAVLPAALLSLAALAPAAHAAAAAPAAAAPAAVTAATARIQALLSRPAGGTVNLPAGTYTIAPRLTLPAGEKIVGHHTTLKVAARSGNYTAVLSGATPATDLSGLTITGVTFNQNAAGNPMASITAAALYHGSPRFVLLISTGTGITITGDTFAHSDNVNTIATGSATRNVTISRNHFTGTTDAPMHDHSTIYTSGTHTTITANTFTGRAAYATAIEVHGTGVTVTANHITGYYKGANIDGSRVTFTANTITAAANPIDIWSTAPAATTSVTITRNTLNINRPYWTTVLHHIGRTIPAPAYTRQIIRDATSTLPFHHITIHANTTR